MLHPLPLGYKGRHETVSKNWDATFLLVKSHANVNFEVWIIFEPGNVTTSEN